MKKSAIRKIGGYTYQYKDDVFQDYELWLKGKNQLQFYNIQKILLLQRFRRNSLSRKNINEKYKLHYLIQEPYYFPEEIRKFGVCDKNEEIIFRGWREYFYGEKCMARTYWKSLNIEIFKDYRIIIAYLLTFLTHTNFGSF